MARNVQLGSGKVHRSTDSDGFAPGPDCGGNRAVEGYRVVKAAVNCKNCLKLMAVEPDAEINSEDVPMAESTDTTREQITANIERIRSLTEAENTEGVAEIVAETEALIKGIKGTGSTKTRAELNKALTEAIQAQPAETPAPTAEVDKPAAGVVVLETTDYKTVPAVVELIQKGSEVVATGINVQRKASETARSVAEVLFEMRLNVRNKNGDPDLKANNFQARLAAREVYENVTRQMDDTPANRDTVEDLMRSVQRQMSQVVVDFVRSMDAEENRERAGELFGSALKANPEMERSAAIFAYYKLNPKSQQEIAREKQAAKALAASREAIASGEGDDESGEGGEASEAAQPQESPDEYAKGLVIKMAKALRGVSEGIEKFKAASDETKEEIKPDLEDMIKVLRALVAETV